MQQEAEKYWLECIRLWYPEWHTKTYFLPPLHFNRVPYVEASIAEQHVLVPTVPKDALPPRPHQGKAKTSKSRKIPAPGFKTHSHRTATAPHDSYSPPCTATAHHDSYSPPCTVYDKDIRDDNAQQRVLHCLSALGDNGQKQEVMMVISQLQFCKYLNKSTYFPAVSLLRTAVNLPQEYHQLNYHQGEIDVLIIHSQLGLITIEIKSVGANFSQLKKSEDEEDDVIMRKAKEAVDQLNKTEKVLLHFVSDFSSHSINIVKILAMPNVKSNQLLRAIKKHSSIKEDLCQCLGVQNYADAVRMCLLSDQIFSPWHPSNTKLYEWWNLVSSKTRIQHHSNLDLYDRLVSRFCGPATTVDVHCVTAPRLEIRTIGQGVSETGERMTRLVLIPEQVSLLTSPMSNVFLLGPPGTGKTTVLVMHGLTYLQQQLDVHVISTWPASCAMTIIIEHQLKTTARSSSQGATKGPGRVYYHSYDFSRPGEVRKAVNALRKTTSNGKAGCIIADEAGPDGSQSFAKFCDDLKSKTTGMGIWAAAVHLDFLPKSLKNVSLTTPLRSPPTVIHEVKKAYELQRRKIASYTPSQLPAPTDGPPVMHILHRSGRLGHIGERPRDCAECGREVYQVLKCLHIGPSAFPCDCPLQYRDVLVLLENPLFDEVTENGRVVSIDVGLVRGLQACDVPLRVVKSNDEHAIRETALAVENVVTVAHWDSVRGLERKVVVVTKYRIVTDILYSVSRCSSQLVIIDW